MWSLDEPVYRWITRSSGESVSVGSVVYLYVSCLDIMRDEEFQDLFLETYTAFTYCSEVFAGLRLRFDAAATDYQAAKTRAFRRQRYWRLNLPDGAPNTYSLYQALSPL